MGCDDHRLIKTIVLSEPVATCLDGDRRLTPHERRLGDLAIHDLHDRTQIGMRGVADADRGWSSDDRRVDVVVNTGL